MATTTYGWTAASSVLRLNTGVQGEQQEVAIATNAAQSGWLAVWASNVAGPRGRIVGSDGTPLTEELTIGSDESSAANPSVAALPDGRWIVTYMTVNPDWDIRGALIDADGSTANLIDIAAGPAIDHAHDVAVLADGGFVVSWARHLGGTDNDLHFSVYNADGSVRHASDVVVSNPGNTNLPSVAALAGGGFVVAWEEAPVGAGDSQVRYRRFDSAGNALNGSDANGVLIDNFGDNGDIHAAGLPDGGFAFAYADDSWGDRDITARIFKPDGTPASPAIHVNALSQDGVQQRPTLAVLPEGLLVVGWRSDALSSTYPHQQMQAFDFGGNAVGAVSYAGFQVYEGELAPLGAGIVAHVWSSVELDTGDRDIRSLLLRLQRTVDGDDTDETIVSVDGLHDVIYARGGADTIDSGGGDDSIYGGAGNDSIDGAGGIDTAVFSQSLHNFVVLDLGSRIVVGGPDGYDSLTGIERLQFADGVLDVADEGNALFDALFYFSRNSDVFHAGADALDHFNAFGRHEGRDPNAFFDTSGYLAANPDVAAGGASPLEHYHQAGWREGRDPSAAFDTTLYLIHNPDVAAAGIDPLAHFLQFGFAEGRAPHLAVGAIADGFDAQRYLFLNPDVAAAGVDPRGHFDTFGWHEGRNPNGIFDTAGYLAHYADVAAAGVNPLEHYLQFGWKEGRDPSAGFDTLGYLAANPDVAAAGVNPLEHDLMFGVYEGRQAVNDGIWH